MKPKHKIILDAIVAESLTTREAAAKFNLSVAMIGYLCRKYGVTPRRAYTRRSYTRRAPSKFAQLNDKEWLHQKVVVEDATYQEVADLVGCTRQYVHQKAKAYGLIESRRAAGKSGRRRKRSMRLVPLRGLLKEKRLHGEKDGKRYIGRVFPSGRIQLIATGQLFDTPDEAAQAICEQPTDGWAFWSFKNADGVWVPLTRLKKKVKVEV